MVSLFEPGYLPVGDFALKTLWSHKCVCPRDMNESLCCTKQYGKMLTLLIHNQNYVSFYKLGQQKTKKRPQSLWIWTHCAYKKEKKSVFQMLGQKWVHRVWYYSCQKSLGVRFINLRLCKPENSHFFRTGAHLRSDCAFHVCSLQVCIDFSAL